MKHNLNNTETSIPVVILAGGQSNRLRIDNKLKWQLPFHSSSSGNHLFDADDLSDSASTKHSINNTQHNNFYSHEQTLLAYIIERLKLQSNNIIINGPHTENTALNEYQLPVIADLLPDFQGPLSGILTALNWAKEHKQQWVATVSCDTPFFSEHLLKTLSKQIINNRNDNKKAAIAVYNERTHPTFGVWSVELFESLKHAIEVDEIRAVNRWALTHAQKVDFEALEQLSNLAEPQDSAKLKTPLEEFKSMDPFFNINTLQDYTKALSFLK